MNDLPPEATCALQRVHELAQDPSTWGAPDADLIACGHLVDDLLACLHSAEDDMDTSNLGHAAVRALEAAVIEAHTAQPRESAKTQFTGVSLFTGGGIGDLSVRACGVHVLVAAELLTDRAEVYRANYPETLMITGDIRKTKKQVLTATRDALDGRPLDILEMLTPQTFSQ